MKHKPLSKKLREQVYQKCSGHCGYCGCELEYKDMQVDHINSVYHNFVKEASKTGNWLQDDASTQDNSFDNLIPSCRMCNYNKDVLSIEDFRNRLSETLMRNVRKPFDYRLALKYGLITENIKPIKFYFEQIYDIINDKK